MNQKLGIVILNYNHWGLTIKCIESIQRSMSDNSAYKVIIVDNGSLDGSYDKLYARYSEIPGYHVIDAHNNLGFSYGNNIGIKAAVQAGCERILVTNNDVIFSYGAIEDMCSVMNDKAASLVSPIVYTQSGTVQEPFSLLFCRSNVFLTYIIQSRLCGIFPFKQIKKKYSNVLSRIIPTEIYWFPGCCFLLDSKSIVEVNYLDESTFLYFEEAILSEKFYTKGMKMYIDPQASIVHLGGGSTPPNKNMATVTNYLRSKIIYYCNYRHIPWFFASIFLYLRFTLNGRYRGLNKKQKRELVRSIQEAVNQ